MAIRIVMPQLGESVSEGVVARWLKRVGDRVQRDEPLVEVTTDKVNAEIPAIASGTLRRISVQEGETVAVGTEIAILDETEAAAASVEQPSEGQPPEGAPPSVPSGTLEVESGRQRTSPLVRRLAQEHGVELSAIQGTGLNGRVTKEDILAYVERQRREAPPVAAGQPPAYLPTAPMVQRPQPVLQSGDQLLKVTPIRRMIAEHMVRSKSTIPHATTFVEVDMTELAVRRTRLRDDFQRREGFDITYLAFVVQGAIEGLRQFPILNAEWAGEHIVVRRQINIGIAVAAEEGLVVPVIHDAGQQSINGLARSIRDLTEKARAGKLTLDEVRGGTFTINNAGALGTILSVPIINEPQAGMLTMDAVVKRPVVVEGDAIAIRSMMVMGLAFDHRVIDGLTAGRFLGAVKAYLEKTAPAVTV